MTGIEGDRVRLAMRDGAEQWLQPDRLPRNLNQDAVSIHQTKRIELHAGDRIRWTDNDRDRGLANGGMARVEAAGLDGLVVSSLADGQVHELKPGDRMAERLDLAYAINIHVAQGVTTDHGIVALRASERRLLSERSFLVALTRIADKVTLVADDPARVARGVGRNAGDKASALDVVERAGKGEATWRAEPPAPSPVDAAVERYARLFLGHERMQAEGGEVPPITTRNLETTAAALDGARPSGAEDLRVVLDRLADPGREAIGALRRAWVEEGRSRGDSAVYAERFVADWQAASAALSMAETATAETRAERRIERLEERMLRQPALERALDRAMPERQLRIDDAGAGGPGRTRDFDIGM